ncbi:hypothetical protein ACN47E_010203 [Coniothyrium glycines]
MHPIIHLALRAVEQNSTQPNATSMLSRQSCRVGTCPAEWQVIAYRPSIAGNTVYMVLFLALLLGQLWLGQRHRTWAYTSTVCLGVGGEAAGYVARVLLHVDPFSMDYFLVNLVPLTIAPALVTAGIYLGLSRVVTAIGSENSRVPPKWYTYIFVGCDLVALILQGTGGGMAATARDSQGSRLGVNIMIAGLISQVVTMMLFLGLWADVVRRVRRSKAYGALRCAQPSLYDELRATRRFRFFQWSLFLATILIFIRCIYRVAELWEGFSGKLANHEVTFMIFEGQLIILAVAAMTVFHPGRVFGTALWVAAGKGFRSTTAAGKFDEGSENLVDRNEMGRHETAYQPIERSGERV